MTDVSAPELSLPVRSEELLNRLATRRSAPAQQLAAPAPTGEELQTLLTLALRTPDHGKLTPWRLVVLGAQTRAEIVEKLTAMTPRLPDPVKGKAVLSKLANPPLTVLVVSSPVQGHKVPVWEQELSAGAVCMNIEHAANALGYNASWITDWYSFDAEALALFGVKEGEKVAGFIHIGTLPVAPLERPRPAVSDRVEILP
ncbi:nitroreductase [uncultured Brevundimonas sp.]|uniref:nitroreductase family protein n=1 Tax=uncultured Brevundimonas sp. TaxID=213418 RepID=UPI00262DF314|nr:nitroreductase [uncultured Brevundimonas sp.]